MCISVEGTQDSTTTATRLLLTDAPAVLFCPLASRCAEALDRIRRLATGAANVQRRTDRIIRKKRVI
jgi:hypothetical protein